MWRYQLLQFFQGILGANFNYILCLALGGLGEWTRAKSLLVKLPEWLILSMSLKISLRFLDESCTNYIVLNCFQDILIFLGSNNSNSVYHAFRFSWERKVFWKSLIFKTFGSFFFRKCGRFCFRKMDMFIIFGRGVPLFH